MWRKSPRVRRLGTTHRRASVAFVSLARTDHLRSEELVDERARAG
jgi:hypothetical protein